MPAVLRTLSLNLAPFVKIIPSSRPSVRVFYLVNDVRMHLERFAYSPFGTLGRLYVNESTTLFTIERPWQGNEPFVSCIPPGPYTCRRYSSPKYPNTFEVCDVPGRSKILFHVANWARNVQGCIGLGLSLSQSSCGVNSSRDAIDKFMALTQDVDEFELLIGQFKPDWPEAFRQFSANAQAA